MADALVGRQAIYGRSLKVHAYELLYRKSAAERQATHLDGDLATAQVITDAFLSIGALRIAGELPCFLNLTRSFITGDLPLPLPAERVVAEVLEDVLPTPDVVAGVARLKAQGARIALDDYVHSEGQRPLLELADYVKVDLRAQSRDDTRALFQLLRPYGMKLLAEKVETMEEFRFCEELGFDYYQGFFLQHPEIVEGCRVPTDRLGLLRVLSRLLDPDVELEEIEELISQDASLAYKLLRHVNSALYAPRQEITAVQQTLVMLGLRTIRKVVSLIILVDLDDRPGDLISQSLVRAKMCQSLAENAGHDNENSYFTAGLLSTLDALAGASMEEVLKQLPLSQELAAALLGHDGPLGAALECVCAYERGDWSAVNLAALELDSIRDSYLNAVEYTQTTLESMSSSSLAA
jgi:c-di-GMP phosphodiesterase